MYNNYLKNDKYNIIIVSCSNYNFIKYKLMNSSCILYLWIQIFPELIFNAEITINSIFISQHFFQSSSFGQLHTFANIYKAFGVIPENHLSIEFL